MNALRLLMLLLAASLWGEPVRSAAPETPMESVSSNKPGEDPPLAPSAWQQAFPEERLRKQANRTVVMWPPSKTWRGDVMVLPGAGNAVKYNGPLLDVVEHLSKAGWRCWLFAREPISSAEYPVGRDIALNLDSLALLQALVSAEPPPPVPPEREGPLPRFLVTQADATTLGWDIAVDAKQQIAGVVLLGAGALKDSPPVLPLFELHIAEEARNVPKASQSRQQRWQHLPQYQQQVLLTSQRHPTTAWLVNAIDGWLRKTALAAATAPADDTLRRQMAAPTP